MGLFSAVWLVISSNVSIGQASVAQRDPSTDGPSKPAERVVSGLSNANEKK